VTNHKRPTVEFTQLCNYLAVRSTLKDDDECVRNLVLQAMVVLPDESFQGPQQCQQAVEVLFGVNVSEARTQEAIDRLLADRAISRSASRRLLVAPETASSINQRIEDARGLQTRVKEKWLAACRDSHPDIDLDAAWSALQEYLARAFRRHGMQTVSLLDPSARFDEGQENLRAILRGIVAERCDSSQAQATEACVANFLANVGSDAERAKFVVQLADGAFAYFALNASPEIARTLQQNLSSLTLFLDTNFLFGILDLHVNPLVQASQELIEIININALPFSLRYHPETEREMRRTVDAISSGLRGRTWPQAISRAAVQSKTTSGLELRFHERNAETQVDPDLFFQPYLHIDVMLKAKDILPEDTSRDPTGNQWLTEYQRYLETRRPEKPQTSILHDAALLDSVHSLRKQAKSSLEAGALCITCDYRLYRFDWEESERRGVQPVMVLPNLFLQLLRPFVPPSWDFDKTFAETFAIPEFRTIDSRSSRATSRLLALLATYQDFPEATATSMLANDMLLGRLREIQDPATFEAQVESAIIAENTELLEDKVELERQIAEERRAIQAKEQQWLTEKQELATQREENLRRAEATEQELTGLEARLEYAELQASSAAAEAGRLRQVIDLGVRIFGSCILGLAWAVGVLGIPGWAHWEWLQHHENRYAIQAVAMVLGACLIGGLFFNSWRRRLWFGSAWVIVLLVALLTLLGGPRQ